MTHFHHDFFLKCFIFFYTFLNIENKDVLTYLGMEISKDGRTMNTIVQRRNKQNGKKKIISNILKPLGQYTFECGMILLNSLIRSSVLYGTEAMYNVTENEIREIERIEEKQMKNIFKAETGIQVPLHIMYLDGGQVPARYQIQRYKLNFMQYILQQDEESLMYQMLEAQINQPVKGDWFSECSKILDEFQITLGHESIKMMSRQDFKRLTKDKSEEKAFYELIHKKEKGSKGSTLKYGQKLQMADYLCPNNQLTVDEQVQIFQIRSHTNPLPSNRGQVVPCPTGCGETLNNSHILQCVVLNQEEQASIEKLINGDIYEMKKTLITWNQNIQKIEEITSQDSI